MLKLAKDLNASIEAGASLTEVQKQAKFLVETEVYPKLSELEAAIKDPAKHWYRRMIDIAKAVPELAANFLTMPRSLAIAKFLGNAANVLGDMRDSQLSREEQMTKSGLYYLLKHLDLEKLEETSVAKPGSHGRRVRRSHILLSLTSNN